LVSASITGAKRARGGRAPVLAFAFAIAFVSLAIVPSRTDTIAVRTPTMISTTRLSELIAIAYNAASTRAL
jgi:hypothetical protein